MYCPHCGAQLAMTRPAQPTHTTSQVYPALRYVMPIDTSLLCVAAGYLGLFSIIIFPAPISVIVSVLALRDIKRRPHLAGKGRAIFGLAMGSLFSIPILLLLATFVYSALTGR